MKIAHFIPSFKPSKLGGAEIHVHNICTKLAEQGHEPVLITRKRFGESFSNRFKYKIDFIDSLLSKFLKYIPLIGKYYIRYLINKVQKKYNFDLWQVTLGYWYAVYAVDYFNEKKIPCVLRCAGEDINKYPEINYGYRLNKRYDRFARLKYPRYQKLIALTESVKQEYLDMNIPESKIAIIPNGVDIKKIDSINLTDKIRKKHNVNKNELLILTVGRHHPKKNFDSIIKIAENLIANQIKFKWIIVGRGYEKFRIKFPNSEDINVITTMVSIDKTESQISLPPLELIEYYKSADLFVFPSLIETFGMVLLEAMAAGLPIVTTDALGVRDVIEDNITGIKVPAKDTNLMTNKIIEVIKDKNLRESLSGKAKNKVKSFYDWDNILHKYEKLYNSLTDK